jgi:hypothetical protein
MATITHSEVAPVAVANGAAMAAALAAAIGSFAMGAFVLLSEAGLFASPTLYGPAGGVSGRTTFAAIVWVVAWGALHARWKSREVSAGPVFTATLVLIGIAVLATFPPLWGLL